MKTATEEVKSPQPSSPPTATILLQPATVCDGGLVVPANSFESMESATHRTTEDREFEKERKRVQYVSAGLSAIFTFLFVVVLVSTIGLSWWYAVVICGVPAICGGMLLLRRYVKETERRRLEMEAEMAALQAPVIYMPYSAMLYEQLHLYALQTAHARGHHCEHSPTSATTVTSSGQPTEQITSPTACGCANHPPSYSLLYPAEGNALPAAT